MQTEKHAPWTALVLSGGGARGAYEAGVIKYIRDELPRRARSHARFEVICGTSIGAMNCCHLAAYQHAPHLQGKMLVDVWQNVRIDGVYKIDWKELFRLPQMLFGSRGRGSVDGVLGPGRLGGIFNTSPMEQLVHKGVSWDSIGDNIRAGHLKALAVNATHVASGKTHVFIQRTDRTPLPFSTDPQIEAYEVTIGPEHALASGAIPWIFPAVEIQGEVYVDGGLKLNTPISPALRLGADRLFIVGLRSKEELKPRPQVKMDQFPPATFLLGKILNALMVDKTEYDLKRLERFNLLLDAGLKAFGETFIETMDQTMLSLRGMPYRKIETFLINPSQDISSIAAKHLHSGTLISRAGSGIISMFLKRIVESSDEQSSDFLSYLLFDWEFAEDLIRLGMHDADAHRSRLIDFFSP